MSAPPELPSYLEMSEEKLYSELATAAIVGGDAVPFEPEQRAALGAGYFAEVLPQIRDAVCGSPAAEVIIDEGDRTKIAIAVAGMIAAHFHVAPVVCTLSVLVARMGLRRLCNQEGP